MPDKQNLLVVNEFHPETLERLDALYHTHHLWRCAEAERPKLIKSLQGRCQAAATGSWTCDPIVFELESLQIIAAFGVGVDGIDIDQARQRNIRVTNTPDVLNDAVADIALALILSTTRKLLAADRFLRRGDWLKTNFPPTRDLGGKTLGIVGLGRIGQAIVHRALPFKLKIGYHNRSPKNLPYSYYPTLKDLAAHSDILLSVLPGGEETDRIIDAAVLESLGPQGIFINVGRGSCVDEHALIQALQTGQIAGAGLDVYEDEPNVPAVLMQMDNVVLLPHIGSGTVETRRAMGDLVIENLGAFFGGEGLVSEVGRG